MSRRPARRRIRRSGRTARRGGPAFRLRAALLVVAILLSVFAGRLVQLQGLDAAAYASMAAAESGYTVTLEASRGDIVDRRGRLLAGTVDAVAVTADPTMTRRAAPRIAAVLVRHLPTLGYLDTVQALRTPDTRFAYLARNVPPTTYEAISAALGRRGLTGVFSESDPLRTYPAKDVAANVVGLVGADGVGLSGLEYAFDRRLSGRDGRATYEISPAGSRIPLGHNSVDAPVPGTGLQITIDRDLQWYAQRRLAAQVRRAGAESGTVVTLDVRSGELLALATYPTFDPNDPETVTEARDGNRPVEEVYEPGSVQKVLTAAALVDAGKVDPGTRISIPGSISRGDHVIHDYWAHGRLRYTMAGVLAKSSNIGTVLAAEQLPAGILRGYLHDLGLGRRALGLPGESRGLLPPVDSWGEVNRATIAYGQGVSVTAVQEAAAVATIANGGLRVEPSLVKGYVRPNGKVVPAAAPDRQRVISARAARQVTRMMEAVTGPEGTAPNTQIPGYRTAGKTGTAQRIDPDCGCYSGFTASYVGFAPADDPRLLTYVVLQDPVNGHTGGLLAGPVFRDVTELALARAGIAPSGSKPPTPRLTW